MFTKYERSLIATFLENYFGTLVATSQLVNNRSKADFKKVSKNVLRLKTLSGKINKQVDVSSDPQIFDRFAVLFHRELINVFNDLRYICELKNLEKPWGHISDHWKNFITRSVKNSTKDIWNNLNLYLSVAEPKLSYYSEKLFATFNSFCNAFDACLDYNKKINKNYIKFMATEFQHNKKEFLSLLAKSKFSTKPTRKVQRN